MSNYYGLPTGILESKHLRLEYLTRAGLRIVRLSLNGGPNLLAELPDFYTETPLGNYLFRGGHRLWRSPEIMPETYIPEKDDFGVEKTGARVRLSQSPLSGISRGIEIHLAQKRAEVTLIHKLKNESKETLSVAPWAVTMFPLGGISILPQPIGNIDQGGFIPNRLFVFWPFTRVQDPRLIFGNDYVLLQARPSLPAIKVGMFNPHGWLGYAMDGILFIKRFDQFRGANYPDCGSNAEVFCNDRFVELESLGPIKELRPGESVFHKETWEIYDNLVQLFIPNDLRKKIANLN